ncbi:MAG TPA: MtrB/PioB family outer membrane beta-barrel protein, partial [Vicinamibacteria bacterium]|nr:MtrB/PioB family outer membrane beta-barrel protein [Vicinamibacteria bacterium]
NFYAFYTWEDATNAQRGRQSGSTVSFNPLDDWTSDVDDKTNSVGGGINLTLVPQKWTAGLFGRYQKVDGNNEIFAPPGGAPYQARVAVGGVQSIPAYDDTKIVALNAELVYRMAKRWSAALGGWFEDYKIDDTNAIARGINYVPGSFFLNGDNGSYRAFWGYARLAFTW